MNIIKNLNWRYATQKFDSDRKVSDKDFEMLMEAVRLSPSSLGLQPWKFVVVKNKDIRKKLREEGSGQDKVTDASHIIVLCRLERITTEYIDRYIELVAKTRNVSVESLKSYRQSRVDSMEAKTKEEQEAWMNQQVYLALGVLLTSCAISDIDACPMGGFDKEKFDEILNLKQYGLKSQVLCAIGYRSPDDDVAKHQKTRFAKKDVVIEI